MILQHFTWSRGTLALPGCTPSVLPTVDIKLGFWEAHGGFSFSALFEIKFDNKSSMSTTWRLKRMNERLKRCVIFPQPTVNLICVILLLSSSAELKLLLGLLGGGISSGVSSWRNLRTKSLAMKTGSVSYKKNTRVQIRWIRDFLKSQGREKLVQDNSDGQIKISKNYFDQFSFPYFCIYIFIYSSVDFFLQKYEATINLKAFVIKSEYYKNVLWLTTRTK